MTSLWMIWQRECRLLRRQNGVVLTHAFLLMAVILLPFGVGSNLPLLRLLGAGIIWIVALLAILLSLGYMFQSDAQDGSLDELRLMAGGYEQVACLKALAHWYVIFTPMLVSVPLAGLLLNMPLETIVWLLASLLCASPALSFLGMIGAALTLWVPRGGLLLGLLVFPFYVPLLIFAMGAFQQLASLLVLLGFSLASMLLAPFVAAVALQEWQ